MALFAVKGTSIFMTILIWFLSLFGIHIGGEDPKTPEYYFIPEGASLVMESETYIGPKRFDKDIVNSVKDGTVYTYGDYQYTMANGIWTVQVLDESKTSYESVYLRTQVVDKDGTLLYIEDALLGTKSYSLDECYTGCKALIDAPDIPAGCVSMKGAFGYCKNLVTPPKVSGSPDMTYAFDGCKKIEYPNGYKITTPYYHLFYVKETDSWDFHQDTFDEENVVLMLRILNRGGYELYTDYKAINYYENPIKLIDAKGNTLVFYGYTLSNLFGGGFFTIQYENNKKYTAALNYWTNRGSCIRDDNFSGGVKYHNVRTLLVHITSDDGRALCDLQFVPEAENGYGRYKIININASAEEIQEYLSYRCGPFYAGIEIDFSGLE